jgi:hypothetical protein
MELKNKLGSRKVMVGSNIKLVVYKKGCNDSFEKRMERLIEHDTNFGQLE